MALSLSTKDRASLAHVLIQSLDREHDEDIDNAWDTEVQARMERFKNGETTDRPAFQALDEIEKKFK